MLVFLPNETWGSVLQAMDLGIIELMNEGEVREGRIFLLRTIARKPSSSKCKFFTIRQSCRREPNLNCKNGSKLLDSDMQQRLNKVPRFKVSSRGLIEHSLHTKQNVDSPDMKSIQSKRSVDVSSSVPSSWRRSPQISPHIFLLRGFGIGSLGHPRNSPSRHSSRHKEDALELNKGRLGAKPRNLSRGPGPWSCSPVGKSWYYALWRHLHRPGSCLRGLVGT